MCIGLLLDVGEFITELGFKCPAASPASISSLVLPKRLTSAQLAHPYLLHWQSHSSVLITGRTAAHTPFMP